MSRIILNPDPPLGGSIKKFTIGKKGTFFIEEPFEAGTLQQFEDEEVADEFLKHFGFLEEMTSEGAKKWMAEGKIKCEKCDFSTRVKTQFEKHIKAHADEVELSELGIPILKKQNVSHVAQSIDVQKQIDSEGTQDGLIGDGLTRDLPKTNIVMS